MQSSILLPCTRASQRTCIRSAPRQILWQRQLSSGGVLRATMTSIGKLDIHSTVKLPSGYDIPRLAFGVYQTPMHVAEDVCEYAMKCGYRHIDSAAAYRNEAESSKGMLATGVPREQLFFTSKVPPKEVSYEGTKNSVKETLAKTGLKYIGWMDLYLLHAPYGGKQARLGAWKALVEAVQAGQVRSIGVSNYGVHHLEELERHIRETDSAHGKGSGGVLSVNQVELHPWLARPDIVRWCEQRGVVLEAYCPLVRATRMDDPRLQALAKKYSKTPAQILLRWGLQKNFIILPKSVTHKRIEENADLYDFELAGGDMKELETGEYAPCAWDPTTSTD